MSRTPKKYINTPFFHIMVQGINKEPIFETSIEAEEYLKLIKQTKEEFDLQILSSDICRKWWRINQVYA